MDFWEIADKYGPEFAMLLFGVVALYTDMVVSGRRYREMRRQRDQLLRLALSGTRANERAASVAERALDALAHRSTTAEADGDAGAD